MIYQPLVCGYPFPVSRIRCAVFSPATGIFPFLIGVFTAGSASLSACKKPQKETSTLKDSVITQVAYGPHTRHTYDIYLPAGRDSLNTPVLVLLHGGGWKYGQKEDLQMLVNLFRTHWKEAAIVNMNYRLASQAEGIHHDSIMADIHRALGHVLSRRGLYQVSDRMCLAGESAGAHLAMIYSYRYNHFNNIRAVGDLYGPSVLYDWQWYNSTYFWVGTAVSQLLTEYVGQPYDSVSYCGASPYHQATSTSPPTIILHGYLDLVVPKYQSDWLHGRLQAIGVPVQYHEMLWGHGLNYYQAEDAVKKMTAFFIPWVQ